jgi:nitrogen fixation-related uncharacterized protein
MAQFSDLDSKLDQILAHEMAEGSGTAGPVTQAQFDSLDAKAQSILDAEAKQSSGVPAAPGAVATSAGSPAPSVNLSWPTVSGASSYNIKRGVAAGSEATIGTSATPTFTDTTVVAGTQYFYVVSAVNASGESVNSAEVSISA